MEGHSTDYQSPEALKEMAEDGIAILKVGPALTFSLRDGIPLLTPKELVQDCVIHLVEDYNYATKLNYMIGDVFFP